MINIVKKVIRSFINLLIKQNLFFLSLVRIKIVTAIRKIRVTEINKFSLQKYKFIVIFASYSPFLDDLTKRFLDGFRVRGGYIVFISNYSHPKISTEGEEPIDVFIHNNGLGRDFGQFKTATEYVYKRIGHDVSEKIIYTNDSIFFVGDSETNNFIDELTNTKFDYVGLFENSGDGLRSKKWFVSSWLFSTSKALFLSKAYQDFFKEYIPHNLKFHAVLNGEMKLSQVVLKFSDRNKVIFNNEILVSLAKDFIVNHGIYEFMEYMPLPFKIRYFMKCKMIDVDLVIEYLERNLYMYSPLHIFNIFLLSQRKIYYVKKDLFFFGNLAFNHFDLLERSLLLLDFGEKIKLIRALRLKGKAEDCSLYKQIKIRFGME